MATTVILHRLFKRCIIPRMVETHPEAQLPEHCQGSPHSLKYLLPGPILCMPGIARCAVSDYPLIYYRILLRPYITRFQFTACMDAVCGEYPSVRTAAPSRRPK